MDTSGSRRAVIDIGTNSVKLLVADVSGRQVRPVLEESEQTRLGDGFFQTNRLQPAALARTARAVAGFAARALTERAVAIRIIATSAARDSINPAELITAVRQASGLTLEIISGDQEADWGFQGVTTDPELAAAPLLLMDVGGGSTEFILGQGEHKHFRESFQIGTVRLLEQLPHGDPPTPEELAAFRAWIVRFLKTEVSPKLKPALRREQKFHQDRNPVQLVGTGGTMTVMARMEARLDSYDRERLEAIRLTRAAVTARVEGLWGLPLARRRQITGLPPERADVILPGVVIYEQVMAEFGFNVLRASLRGLRYAALMGDAPLSAG